MITNLLEPISKQQRKAVHIGIRYLYEDPELVKLLTKEEGSKLISILYRAKQRLHDMKLEEIENDMEAI